MTSKRLTLKTIVKSMKNWRCGVLFLIAVIFIVVVISDLTSTFFALQNPALSEGNPISNNILGYGGMSGLVVFYLGISSFAFFLVFLYAYINYFSLPLIEKINSRKVRLILNWTIFLVFLSFLCLLLISRALIVFNNVNLASNY
jgi:hypothetical protein